MAFCLALMSICLFLTSRLGDLLLDIFINNMRRMHLSDAEAGVNPLFEKIPITKGIMYAIMRFDR